MRGTHDLLNFILSYLPAITSCYVPVWQYWRIHFCWGEGACSVSIWGSCEYWHSFPTLSAVHVRWGSCEYRNFFSMFLFHFTPDFLECIGVARRRVRVLGLVRVRVFENCFYFSFYGSSYYSYIYSVR